VYAFLGKTIQTWSKKIINEFPAGIVEKGVKTGQATSMELL
jgi:hypothetical protein